MCGYQFDPEAHASCQSCPIQKGCHLVCCPNCGFEMVNIHQSVIAQFVTRLLPKLKIPKSTNRISLAEISPGMQARVIDFALSLPIDRKAHLQAYGLVPGNTVQVVQHSPVTVIQVDHTELALENSLARMVQVESIDLRQQ
jgi:Fe2+ transport system protein FeoA